MTQTTTTKFMSKKGIKELKKAIRRLESERRKLIQGLHDLDKTTDHDARLERIERLVILESVDQELNESKTTLAQAHPYPKNSAGVVDVGSTVELASDSGQTLTYMLVEPREVNPSDGRISINSPLGSVLLGKTISDIIHWKRGRKNERLQLVRIH